MEEEGGSNLGRKKQKKEYRTREKGRNEKRG